MLCKHSVPFSWALIGSICRVSRYTYTIGAMDLPSNNSPFRQQLEGSWFRSHLNSSAWHTSFQCAVVFVDDHRSVSTACGSRRHRIARRRSRSTLTEVCVHCGSRRHRIARRRSRSTLTEVCVSLGSRRHAYGWFHTRDLWEARQTVSDHWGFQTEQTTSKWFTVCLMYTWTLEVHCSVLPHWLDRTGAVYRAGKHTSTQ